MNWRLGFLVLIMSAWLAWQVLQPPPRLTLPRPVAGDIASTQTDESLLATELSVEPPPMQIDSYSAIVERPLFEQSRKPLAAPVAGAARPDGRLQVTAVALSATGSYALILTDDGKTHRLAVGEDFQHWTLSEVRSDGVTMRSGDEIRALPLLRQAPPPTVEEAARRAGLMDENDLPANTGEGASALTPMQAAPVTETPTSESLPAAVEPESSSSPPAVPEDPNAAVNAPPPPHRTQEANPSEEG